MRFKSAKDVIEVAMDRGFTIHVNQGPPPMPFLRGPGGKDNPNATEALMTALKAWRLEIIEELTAKA